MTNKSLTSARELADEVEYFPLGHCGPSDDPDKQTAYLYAFRELATRFAAAVRRLHDDDLNAMLADIDIKPETIEDSYTLRAELRTIIDALQELDEESLVKRCLTPRVRCTDDISTSRGIKMQQPVRENALILLKGLYDETAGDTQNLVKSKVVVEKLDMDRQVARAALRYLIDKHLVKDSREMAELPAVFISAAGVDAIEDALHAPQRATAYFPPAQSVTHNTINIGTWQSGAIQQGTVGSTQTVSDETVDFARLADELKQLRQALKERAETAEHDAAIGHIASAESAAKGRDEERLKQAVASLGSMGGWVLEAAKAIGVSVTADLIQNALK